MTIENRLGHVLRERGIKPQELAKRTGISHNTALALYRGVTTRLDLPVLDKICHQYGLQPGEFLVWTPDQEPA
jgi:DNA-binding Xre family transcriptional regulator